MMNKHLLSVLLTATVLCCGCQQTAEVSDSDSVENEIVTANATAETEASIIEYVIEDVDIYSKIASYDSYANDYQLCEVYNNSLFIIEYEIVRDEWGVNDTNIIGLYQYDIDNDNLETVDISSLNIDNDNGEKILNYLEVSENLYFYIIASQDGDIYQTSYYLDEGDRENLIFQTSNEFVYYPNIVVDNDDIYFVVADTSAKSIEIGLGYDKYSNLRIIKLNETGEYDTFFETEEEFYGFSFNESQPLSFIAFYGNDEAIVYAYEDNEFVQYSCGEAQYSYAAFDDTIYAVHDNEGDWTNNEMYWVNLKTDVQTSLNRRAVGTVTVGIRALDIDDEGLFIVSNSNGIPVITAVEDGLDSPLYIRKISDSSALIICQKDVIKKITLS